MPNSKQNASLLHSEDSTDAGASADVDVFGNGPPTGICSKVSTRVKLGILIGTVTAAVGAGIGIVVSQDATSTAAPQPVPSTRPVIVNTWWGDVTQVAFDTINQRMPALDAVEVGCSYAEAMQKDTTVGYGGSPDTNGETTLDALIMDGNAMDVGAVGYLRNVKHAITTARRVMQYTRHTMLAGDGATDFAVMTGLPKEYLNTTQSDWMYGNWTQNNCQPNYWQNVRGASNGLLWNETCGPYTVIPTPTATPYPLSQGVQRADGTSMRASATVPTPMKRPGRPTSRKSQTDHDTVGMCGLDVAGNIALGMSSNGANHKVAGRIGDAPLIGAGGYASNEGGCAAATGDGDITARFLPAFTAVENMRRGMTPQAACDDAIKRIVPYYPQFDLGLVCMDKYGNYAGSSHGWVFTWCAASPDTDGQAVCTQQQPIVP